MLLASKLTKFAELADSEIKISPKNIPKFADYLKGVCSLEKGGMC